METTFKLLHDTVDALVALKMDIQCAEADHAVVLSPDRARRACQDIDRSIQQIRAALARLAPGQPPGH